MKEPLPPEELNMQLIRLGVEAEAFMGSELGEYLKDRAELHKLQHMQLLYEASPEDKKANVINRIEISAADKFIEWMNEAVNSGRTAHMQLRASEAQAHE